MNYNVEYNALIVWAIYNLLNNSSVDLYSIFNTTHQMAIIAFCGNVIEAIETNLWEPHSQIIFNNSFTLQQSLGPLAFYLK